MRPLRFRVNDSRLRTHMSLPLCLRSSLYAYRVNDFFIFFSFYIKLFFRLFFASSFSALLFFTPYVTSFLLFFLSFALGEAISQPSLSVLFVLSASSHSSNTFTCSISILFLSLHSFVSFTSSTSSGFLSLISYRFSIPSLHSFCRWPFLCGIFFIWVYAPTTLRLTFCRPPAKPHLLLFQYHPHLLLGSPAHHTPKA